jgi:acyl carrier protein
LNVQSDVVGIIARDLGLGERARAFGPDTALLGSVPELDSMAVATLIGSIEDHFGFAIDDDEIDAATFATVGSLVAFVQSKLAA